MGNIMSEGEVFQLTKCGDINMTRDDYLNIIEKKTAVLISASCAAGAILGSASPEKIDAMARFGKNAGMAFQITDDILDYAAKDQTFGKSIGKDLEEGKITLPLIFALKQSTDEEKNTMKEILSRKKSSRKAALQVRTFIEKYEGLELSRYTAAGYIKEAKRQLDVFEDCAEKKHLITVADYILSRNV